MNDRLKCLEENLKLFWLQDNWKKVGFLLPLRVKAFVLQKKKEKEKGHGLASYDTPRVEWLPLIVSLCNMRKSQFGLLTISKFRAEMNDICILHPPIPYCQNKMRISAMCSLIQSINLSAKMQSMYHTSQSDQSEYCVL